jgi:hypothetical protein
MEIKEIRREGRQQMLKNDAMIESDFGLICGS